MNPIPSLRSPGAAAANAFDMWVGGGVADLRRMPATILDEGPQRTVYRYRRPRGTHRDGPPVLLVPPLAAPTSCFDLRRGCSLAEHLLSRGHPTYVVDYGTIGFSDRALGLEHWVDQVIPTAIDVVSEDAGSSVQLVGWCLGGILSLLAVAGTVLPVKSVAMIASPFDFARVRLIAPIRPFAEFTGGAIGTALYRLMGGVPEPLVRAGYQLAAIDKYLLKPLAVGRHLDDREFLAQVEAVDDFTRNMLAYPGRTFGQLYHRFFIVNELAGGELELSDRTIALADVHVPVLSVAGEQDSIAPKPAVHAVGDLLSGAPEVRLESAPGGHLGVLTGRAAVDSTWRYLDEFLADTAGVAEPARAA
jgi:polyhydroxyalkanoate synthase subunit PhaC